MEKKFVTLLSCVCLFSCALGLPHRNLFRDLTVKNCGKSILPPNSFDRIVGGRYADHGRHPWMVALLKNVGRGFNHNCGGAVLNENWIVTAAHCVKFYDEPHRYRVVVGLHKLSRKNAPTAQTIEVEEIIPHRYYDKATKEHDIALIKTAKPINLRGSKGYINGICLPETDEDPTGYGIVAGWGDTYEDGSGSDTMREVVLPIVHRNPCDRTHRVRITEGMICAGVTGKDSCQGDSGGPLIQTSPDGKSTLIGVVSFGRGCGRVNSPGAYTKVSAYKRWMKNIMST